MAPTNEKQNKHTQVSSLSSISNSYLKCNVTHCNISIVQPNKYYNEHYQFKVKNPILYNHLQCLELFYMVPLFNNITTRECPGISGFNRSKSYKIALAGWCKHSLTWLPETH